MLVSDEELLRGDIAGLPEVIQPAEEVPEGYEWATTEYLYDITQEYYQVIEETTTKDNTTTTTAYAYGVERIVAYDTNATTQYIYDGRGSVVQTISAPAAGTSVSAALPQVAVQSYAYTAFGEQMRSKTSGFAYNAEDYDAGTGMINLRMRQYEPAQNRFSSKDLYRGSLTHALSLHRYLFVYCNPINWIDADGLRPADIDEAAMYFVERQSNSTAKKNNVVNRLKGYTAKLEADVRRWENEISKKDETIIAQYLIEYSQTLNAAVIFARTYKYYVADNATLISSFEAARAKMTRVIAQMHVKIGRSSSGVNVEDYRSICEQTFKDMSSLDMWSITRNIYKGRSLEEPYISIYNETIVDAYIFDEEDDISGVPVDEQGYGEVFVDFGPPYIEYSGTNTPAEQIEVDITDNQGHPKSDKMPVGFLKGFVAQACESDPHYSGAQTFHISTDGNSEYDCVSLAGRAAQSAWFSKDAYQELEIGTYVKRSYNEGENQRKVTPDMERYDGMQLCRVKINEQGEEVFTHQAVYFTEIEIDGVIWRDVIIDIRGDAYPDNATEEKKEIIDQINQGNGIRITPYDHPRYGYSFYKYAFDLKHVDYSEVKRDMEVE